MKNDHCKQQTKGPKPEQTNEIHFHLHFHLHFQEITSQLLLYVNNFFEDRYIFGRKNSKSLSLTEISEKNLKQSHIGCLVCDKKLEKSIPC